MNTLRKDKVFWSIMCCFILIICAFVVTKSYTASADSDVPTCSWANISSAGTDFLNNAVTKTVANYADVKSLTAKTAGGLVGYTNSDITKKGSMSSSVNSRNDAGNVEYQYAALESDGLGDGFKAYGQYGLALQQLGLDQTESNGFAPGVRGIVGKVVLVAFLLTEFLQSFWAVVLGVLTAANPFYIVTGGAMGGSMSVGYGKVESVTGVDQLASLFGNLYSTAQGLGIGFIIPLSVAFAIFVWLVVRQGKDAGTTFKNVMIRIVFVAIGIPLCITLYTTVLGWVGNLHESTGGLAADAIASVFVDFESWVVGDVNGTPASDAKSLPRLEPVAGGPQMNGSDIEKGMVKSEFVSNARVICGAVNAAHASSWGGSNSVYKSGGTGESGLYKFDAKVLEGLGKTALGSGTTNEAVAKGIVSLLDRYSKGEKISAASFENRVKSYMKGPAIFAVSSVSEDVNYYDSERTGGRRFELKNSGLGEIILEAKDVKQYAKDRFGNPSKLGEVEGVSDYNLYGDTGGGMSYMAMYNYLSSTFDSSQITVYGATDTSGKIAKAEHYCVNVVGSTAMQVLYIADLVVLLCAFCVVGYAYGFGLLVANFRAMLKIIPAALAGVAGFMQGIAATLVIVAALIVEVLGTFLIYALGVELMAILYKIIEAPLSSLIGTVLNGVGGPTLFPIVSGVASMFIIITIMKKMITYRYAVCQAVSEQCTAMINKFLNTSAANPNLGTPMTGAAQKLGAVALAGAGVAALANEKTGGNISSIGERLGLSASANEDKAGEEGGSSTSSSSEESSETSSTGGALGTRAGQGKGSGGSNTSLDDGMSTSEAEAITSGGFQAGGKSTADGRRIATVRDGKAVGGFDYVDKMAGKPYGLVDANGNVVGQVDPESMQFDDNGNLISATTTDGEALSFDTSVASDNFESFDTNSSGTGNPLVDNSVQAAGQSASGAVASQVMTVTGTDGQSYTMMKADGSGAYTIADKESGAGYKLVSADGKELVNSTTGSTTFDAGSITTDASGNLSVSGVAGAGSQSLSVSAKDISSAGTAVATGAGGGSNTYNVNSTGASGGALNVSGGSVNVSGVPQASFSGGNVTISGGGQGGGTVISAAGAAIPAAAGATAAAVTYNISNGGSSAGGNVTVHQSGAAPTVVAAPAQQGGGYYQAAPSQPAAAPTVVNNYNNVSAPAGRTAPVASGGSHVTEHSSTIMQTVPSGQQGGGTVITQTGGYSAPSGGGYVAPVSRQTSDTVFETVAAGSTANAAPVVNQSVTYVQDTVSTINQSSGNGPTVTYTGGSDDGDAGFDPLAGLELKVTGKKQHYNPDPGKKDLKAAKQAVKDNMNAAAKNAKPTKPAKPTPPPKK